MQGALADHAESELHAFARSQEDGHAALTFYPLGSSRQALVLVEDQGAKTALVAS